MKMISLTRGFSAMVDDEDFDRLASFRWHAAGRAPNNVYGARRLPIERGAGIGYLHREVLQIGDNPSFVDHINGNRLDCRKSNLRMCSPASNLWNSKKRTDGSSKFKGVHYYRSRGNWTSQIQVNKVQRFLGYFDDEYTAARAYDKAARRYFGHFARLNFPRSGEQQA